MRLMVALTALVACAGTASFAQADIVSSDPYALGGGRVYIRESPTRYFRPAFFDVFVDDWSWSMMSPPHQPPSPGSASPGSTDLDNQMSMRLNGLPPGTPVIIGGGSFFDVFVEINAVGGHVFDTEMLSMDLDGHLNGTPFMIRESPTLRSTGRYVVTPAGGGLFHIDSFFDVFTELSLDGGQTWTPAEGPTHFSIVPSPGAAALLGLGALAVGRRRR